MLERDEFEALLGDLSDTMEKEQQRREEMGKKKEDMVTTPARQREKRQLENIPFSELRQLKTIGTGTFGRVKLVQHTQSV